MKITRLSSGDNLGRLDRTVLISRLGMNFVHIENRRS